MAAGQHSKETIENVIKRLQTCLERCRALQDEMKESGLTSVDIEGQGELERALFYLNKWPENGIGAVRMALNTSLDIGSRVKKIAPKSRAPKKKSSN